MWPYVGIVSTDIISEDRFIHDWGGAPSPIWLVLLSSEKLGHTHTGKATWGDEGRHHSDAAKARKSERLPVNTRSRTEAWNTFSFSVLRRSQCWWHLGLGLLSFRLLNSKFLLFQPPRSWYILWQPNDLIHQFRTVPQHLFDHQRYFFSPLWGWLLFVLVIHSKLWPH